MRKLKYIVYKEGDYYVTQCLNVDVSSFGDTVSDAVANLKEALELYFEDAENNVSIPDIREMQIGETSINV